MTTTMTVPPEGSPSCDQSRVATWWRTFRGLPRPVRVATHATIALVLVLIATTIAGVVLVRRPLPQTSGELELPGLDAEVTVIRDEHGIPQLYGDTVADLMRAQGFVHAQERFYEMDVRRHATAGRLAELFGEDALESDRIVRTMGWRRVAEQELALVEPETREALAAYSEGVNAYLKDRPLSEIAVEYTILRASGLDYQPEDWDSVDSLAWLKAMAWDLRGNMQEEINRALALAEHTPAEVADLYPPYPYDRHEPIASQGAVVDGVFDQDSIATQVRPPQRPAYPARQRHALERVSQRLDAIPSLVGRGEGPSDGLGSNSWVVDGEHSATGEPLLANDPHLGVTLPGIWVQMGLHCRTVSEECPLDVSGFTFSGVPGVVIGHNADIAWGFTNLGPDVTDLYLERVDGDRWRHDGRLRPLETRTEVIRVRGEDDVPLTVRSTDHGPLLSEVSEELTEVGEKAPTDHPTPSPASGDEGYAVSLAWTALEPAPTADAILRMNTASDWKAFRAAAAEFAVPAQNLVYADRAGHIGYQAPGRIPIREAGNAGLLPAEGWRAEDDWTGDYVPFEALPSVLDPDEGFVVAANQAVTARGFPYYLTDDWDRGYRAQRIRDLIEQEGDLSVAEMSELQTDDRSPIAPTLTPYLLDVDLPRGYYSDGQRKLAGWDYAQSADSAAAAYFNAVWRKLLALTFHDDLRESLWPDGGQRWMAVVEGLLDDPASAWWDDTTTEDERETRDDILRRAQREARDELTQLQALDPDGWGWGHLHQLHLENQSLGQSGIGPVEALLNRGGWETPGGGALVNANAWNAVEGYDVTAAPSMRMVVSMADLDDSRWINLTGVSGHPASDHYTDQTDLWAAGETLPWAFSAEAVAAAAEDTLTLLPAQEE